MTAQLQRTRPVAANDEWPVGEAHREAPMIADTAVRRMPEPRDSSGHKLRNRILLANAVAWVAIIALIRHWFF